MSTYSSFFFASRHTVAELDLVEFSHPSFSKVYRLVRNLVQGVTVTLEDGSQGEFEYYPMKIQQTETATNLDQTMQITFGDLGKIMPMELDLARAANTMKTYPLMTFRVYRSDDLSAPIEGPLLYEINNVPRTKTGASLNVSARRLNQNSTGELYDPNRFPGLRAV
jgi:hypothetical protein